MKTKPNRGSHLPVLMKLFNMTSGPILELGSGMYSTPYLHWACYPSKRRLVTYEDNPEWIKFAEQFITDYHSVKFVTDWDALDLNEPFTIALVDHDSVIRRYRSQEAARLQHVDYVVCHDAENKSNSKYHYFSIYHLFKYRWKYTNGGLPYTAVFSNKHDLKEFYL